LGAQQPALAQIGFLNPAAAEDQLPHLTAAFRRGLAEAGYVEGKNLAIQYRFTSFRPELMPDAATDLVRLNVSVIFAPTPEAGAAAKDATNSIPIVALDLESDPVAKGFIKSLAHPGGNMTGMFLDLPEFGGKQLRLLKEIAPRLSRIAIIGVKGLNAAQFAATESAARTLALEAESMEVRVADDFERALEAAGRKHIEAGILLSSPLVFANMKQISDLAIALRLPLICVFAEFPKVGGLISYGPDLTDMFRRCGDYVAKILRGASPRDLPISGRKGSTWSSTSRPPRHLASIFQRSSNSLPTK
jgi:putative ABC transport system substrate-binding protein